MHIGYLGYLDERPEPQNKNKSVEGIASVDVCMYDFYMEGVNADKFDKQERQAYNTTIIQKKKGK